MSKEIDVQWANEEIGDLNEKDGYNCDICLNKGKIFFLEDGKYVLWRYCECMKTRNIYHRLNECGITKNVLNNLSFDTWETDKEWQRKALDRCKQYVEAIKNGGKNWLVMSGQSGSGKTHLCTAIFQELIKQANLKGIYMMWNTEIPRLIALRKSTFTDNQEKYDKLIEDYKETDVLYIDDLFKLDAKMKEDSLSLAYEIINYRYINDKITIISTETTKDQFKLLDMALCGRCVEKSNGYWFSFKGETTNYRFKGE